MKKYLGYFPILLLLSLLNSLSKADLAEQPALLTPTVLENAELIALGKRIYREGKSFSNQVINATVQGDVPFSGNQFTCVSCHRRSGMGAIEGDRIVPPVTGLALYNSSDKFWANIDALLPNATSNRLTVAKRLAYKKRPAYTDQTLARAIRSGIDATGQPLEVLMPRYNLSESEMSALIAYLKTLSTQFSLGVTDQHIYFATVFTEEVKPLQQQAMLAVLETYFQDKNSQTRDEIKRLKAGPFYHDYKNKAYRQWILVPWLLTGSPATWAKQLENYYQHQPIFAMLSGISTHSWQPIHRFCETHQIPCLLPNTDRPAIHNNDFYTLYFSKGIVLEALAIAQYLTINQPAHLPVLQVFRPNTAGALAAQAVRQALSQDNLVSVTDWTLALPQQLTPSLLLKQLNTSNTTTVILWLSEAELVSSTELDWQPVKPLNFYFSSTLLNRQLTSIPPTIRDSSWVAHPYSLPTQLEQRSRRVKAWLKSRHLMLEEERIQAQTYFAALIASEGLMHIKRYFYRDYLLDSIDHAEGMALFSVFYPRLSFGPGQRYLAKGCYILELGTDDNHEITVQNTSWIVPSL